VQGNYNKEGIERLNPVHPVNPVHFLFAIRGSGAFA
jgi:hypothetical protein